MSYAVMTASDNGDAIQINGLDDEYQNLADFMGFNLDVSSDNLSMPVNGRIKYNNILASLAAVVSANVAMINTGSGVYFRLAIYKNGSRILETVRYAESNPIILDFPLTLSNNDYLELWMSVSDDIGTIEVSQCQFSITQAPLL